MRTGGLVSVASLVVEGIPRHRPLRNQKNSQHADVGTGAEVARPDGEPPPPPTESFSAQEHALQVQRGLKMVHEALRQSKVEVKQEGWEEPPLYAPDNWV